MTSTEAKIMFQNLRDQNKQFNESDTQFIEFIEDMKELRQLPWAYEARIIGIYNRKTKYEKGE